MPATRVPARPARPLDVEALRLIARAGEPDRTIAATLAPRDRRADALACAAAIAEIARIEALVSEPTIGAIRLQWWREALSTPGDAPSGHMVANAMASVLMRRGGARVPVEALLDAVERAITARASGEAAAVSDAHASREACGFALTGAVLGADPSDHGDIFAAAGAAYAAARAFQTHDPADPEGAELTETARAGLSVVRQLCARAPRPVFTALLPLALVEPYLRRYQSPAAGTGHGSAAINPLSRVWHVWRASRRGRF